MGNATLARPLPCQGGGVTAAPPHPQRAARTVRVPPPAAGTGSGPVRRRGAAGRRPRPAVAGLCGSALLASAAALAGGAVSSEYVGSSVLCLVVPGLVGAACAWGATRGAARGRGAVPAPVTLAVAGVYAALSAVLAFRVADTPLRGPGTWLPPVLASVVGVVLWPLLDPRPPVGGAALRRRS